MKKDYIKLYIDNVVCRLPENDRDEVRKELNSNIYDMLSPCPSEEEIKAVLESLGSPAKLAEKYRTNPRYLISPAVYDNYINALKIGVPVVAFICAFLGFISAIVIILTNNISEGSEIATKIIEGFLSSLFSGAIYSVIMITLGFVIYEHANKNKKREEKKFEINQLMDVTLSTENDYISFTGSIAGIIVTVCIAIFVMLFSINLLPLPIWIKHNDIEVYSLFSKHFLSNLLYIVPVLAAAGIFTNVLKIKYRKLNAKIIYSDIATSIIYIFSFAFLFTRPNMLSAEFVDFVKSMPIDSPEVVRAIVSGKGIGAVVISIVTITSLVSIGFAVRKLIKIKR